MAAGRDGGEGDETDSSRIRKVTAKPADDRELPPGRAFFFRFRKTYLPPAGWGRGEGRGGKTGRSRCPRLGILFAGG